MTDPSTLAGWFFAATGVAVILYYIGVNLNYLVLHALALFELRDDLDAAAWNPAYREFASPFVPGVAVVVPAYNEEAVIAESVSALLSMNYPDREVVVVNDGSTDDTLAVLESAFDLVPLDEPAPFEVPCEPIRAAYRSETYPDLLVIDKENGGKSDALNAGVWLTDQELFCAIDSDTVIDSDALLEVVRPFLRYPKTTVATGGTVRVANNCRIESGVVQNVRLPRNPLAGLQVMEYLRAFYSGRLGLDRAGGLVIISGAFGVFRTDAVREIGGYRPETVTEDFEIVVRLHRHFTDADRDYRIEFVPEPVAWTEAPESLSALARQRRRWYRGTLQTLAAHRGMIGDRTYDRVGTYVLPMFVIAETLGPLVEGLGYVLVPLAWALGLLNTAFFLTFLLLAVGFGVFLSWFGVFSEVWSYNRYDDPRQVVILLLYGLLENFGYRQWKTLVAWHGLYEFIRGRDTWGRMTRTGFGGATPETPIAEERD